MSKSKPSPKVRNSFPDWSFLSGKTTIIILAVITLAALLLRYYQLGFLSLWVDEYMHVSPAYRFLKGGSMMQSDNNGIFLTWVIIAFFKLFGASEITARIPSILFGSLSIPLIYFLAKKLFNRNVGIIAAFLGAFSLYAIIWSRIARNYASFEFAYLLLLIVIWMAFNYTSETEKGKNNFFTRNQINKKYLLALPFVFVFSLINHQLTFFAVFGLSTYLVYLAIGRMIQGGKGAFTNFYALASYLIVAAVIVFFTPSLLDKIARPVLGILLPDRIINWVLPDWSYIFTQFKGEETRFACFKTYFNIVKDDYTILYYLGILGLPASFFLQKARRGAAFMTSMFLVPFLLMSFIFRNPCTPNYLLFIYPLFLISAATGLYFIVSRLVPLIAPQKLTEKKGFSIVLFLVIAGLLLAGSPFGKIKELVTTKEHGQVAPKSLIHVGYVNWKGICKKMKRMIAKEDLVLSTWPGATDWYLKRDNSVWFRQRVYDTKLKQYVYREATGEPNTATSYDDLVNTYNNNKKGWFFADYYFDNVMTDPRAKDFIIRNTNYHFDLGNGDVQIFSWNHDEPRKFTNTLAIELGKNPARVASQKLNFNLNTSALNSLRIFIEAEGLDRPNEGFIVINDKRTVAFTLQEIGSTGGFKYFDPRRQYYAFTIAKTDLVNGQNTLQIAYNNQVKDNPRGFVVYNISFLNQ